MIETTPRHRAPQGIVLGIVIMSVFYLGLWLAIRALFPSPALHCHQPMQISAGKPATCKLGDLGCLCPPR